MSLYVIRLPSKLPRRFWIPLVTIPNKRAIARYQELTKKRSARPAVHYQRMTVFWPGVSDRQNVWQFALEFLPAPLISVPLPHTIFSIRQSGSGPATATTKLNVLPFEARIAFRNYNDAGLLISWPLNREPHEYTCLTLLAPNQQRQPNLRELVVSIPEFRIIGNAQPGDRGNTPTQTRLSLLTNLRQAWAPCWICRLKHDTALEIHDEKPDTRRSAVVCIDFGTSTTAASYVPEVVATEATLSEHAPIRDLYPWSHIIGVPEYDQLMRPVLRPGQNQEIRVTWHRGETWPGNQPITYAHLIPEFYTGERAPIAANQARDRTIPSLLLSPRSNGDVDSAPYDQAATAPESAARSDVIGREAENLLFDWANKPGGYGYEPQYAPKLAIGRTEKQATQSVVQFLREYFDQLHYKLLRDGVALHQVQRICYSYPVAWVKHQRDALKQCLEEALKHSYFQGRLLPESERSVDPFHEAFSLEEASAAFLGFVVYRMRGLEGQKLVLAYQPFEPMPQRAREYPKVCWVLVVDSGGGTTDVALLQVKDTGEEGSAVQSYVRHYFGMPKAGLEVTRRIAEQLKGMLLVAAQKAGVQDISRVEKLLRTNLEDESIEDQGTLLSIKDEHTNQPLTELEFRKRKIKAFYAVAEKLKLEMSKQHHAHGGGDRQANPDVQMPVNWKSDPYLFERIFDEPDRERIRRCLEHERDKFCITMSGFMKTIEEVYRPVAEQIRRWFNSKALREELGDRRLDLLILAGRSSMLPGLRDVILGAIPEEHRPYLFDQITSENLFFYPPGDGLFQGEAMKTLVQHGLLLLYKNRILPRTRALTCNPPDSTRRDLAIGILRQDPRTAKPAAEFHPECNLLVEADGSTVDPNQDLVYEETNDTCTGFFIGFNFTSTNANKSVSYDPPLPFLRVRIHGAERGAFRKLRFNFRQRSTSDIYLHSVQLFDNDSGPPSYETPPQSPPASMREGQKLEVPYSSEPQKRSLTISVEPYPFHEDFRQTGRIHSEIDADVNV
jgi:hypothetical protein